MLFFEILLFVIPPHAASSVPRARRPARMGNCASSPEEQRRREQEEELRRRARAEWEEYEAHGEGYEDERASVASRDRDDDARDAREPHDVEDYRTYVKKVKASGSPAGTDSP